MCEIITPSEVLSLLHNLFSRFDDMLDVSVFVHWVVVAISVHDPTKAYSSPSCHRPLECIR
jgi:hypothetical protein